MDWHLFSIQKTKKYQVCLQCHVQKIHFTRWRLGFCFENNFQEKYWFLLDKFLIVPQCHIMENKGLGEESNYLKNIRSLMFIAFILVKSMDSCLQSKEK